MLRYEWWWKIYFHFPYLMNDMINQKIISFLWDDILYTFSSHFHYSFHFIIFIFIWMLSIPYESVSGIYTQNVHVICKWQILLLLPYSPLFLSHVYISSFSIHYTFTRYYQMKFSTGEHKSLTEREPRFILYELHKGWTLVAMNKVLVFASDCKNQCKV